ncbi:hypothetical protein FOZ63_003990, partial [Perkinsus olseni]
GASLIQPPCVALSFGCCISRTANSSLAAACHGQVKKMGPSNAGPAFSIRGPLLLVHDEAQCLLTVPQAVTAFAQSGPRLFVMFGTCMTLIGYQSNKAFITQPPLAPMADFIVDPATAMQSKYTKIDTPFKFSDKSEARTSYRRRLLVEDGDDTPLAVMPREDSVFGKVDREFDGEIDAEILGVPSGARVLEMHSQLQKVSDDLNDMVEDLLEELEKDFFLAYRTHMFTVQRELTSLKNLSDSNETKGRRVQKVRSLEAELQWFTAEALSGPGCAHDPIDVDIVFRHSHIREDLLMAFNRTTAVERRRDMARSGGIPGDTESRAERDSRGREQHSIGPEQSTDTLQEGELRERYDQVVEGLSRSIRTEKAAINRLRDDAGDKRRESSKAQPGPVEGLTDIFTRCVGEVRVERSPLVQWSGWF